MMRFDKYTERAQDAAMRAYEILQRYGHGQADNEHLFLALLEQPEGTVKEILSMLDVDSEELRERLEDILLRMPKVSGMPNMNVGQVYITPRLKRVLDQAQNEAKNFNDEFIATEHLLLSLTAAKGSPGAKVLSDYGVTPQRVANTIRELRDGETITSKEGEKRYRTLEKYSRDLTQMAYEDKLDPVIGRGDEILRVIQVLSRRTKSNPILIGEAGVGKTAIIEGLAQKIADDDVPEILMNRRVLSLDLGSMIAGSRFRGEFEERLKSAIDEIIQSQGEIILFIDEIHTVIGAGAAQGAMDASNMMKPALARGELQCIGATTLDEFKKHIEKDSALERRFAPVYVDEPSVDETIQMLGGIKHRYEAHHNISYTAGSLEAAARLSHRYVTDRRLPDKAIDLIDEAAAKLRVAIYSMPPALKAKKKRLTQIKKEENEAGLSQNWELAAELKAERLRLESEFEEEHARWLEETDLDEVVEVNDIADVIAAWTGIPVRNVMENEAEKLLHIEETLHERIIGQEEAIVAVADALRRARSGLKDPRRPMGSFLFLGSSGVGKTELAKALAEFLFDDQDALLRVDMSEYRESHTVSRLFGAPPGYVGYDEGGQLTEAVRRRPYQVVLFDEVEKAHPDVWNALLQIMEDGRLTDGQGHLVDFRNTVIIMTSNVGTSFGPKGGTLGFRHQGDDGTLNDKEMKQDIEDALRRKFRPEFLNRIDEVIIFHTLTQEQVIEIVDLQMKEIADRLLENNNIQIELSPAAKEWLGKQGYDREFGARPLRRTLQKKVESPLSVLVLKGEFGTGDTVLVDYDAEKEELTFNHQTSQVLTLNRPSEVETLS